MKHKKYSCVFLAIFAGALLTLSGCVSNGDNADSVSLNSAAKVIGNTTFTDEVVTDGNWLVWEGRQKRLLFNNGTTTIDLGAKLNPKYSLGTDNDDEWRGMLFDGRRLLFTADDVTDSDPPQLFMVDTQDPGYKPIRMSAFTAEQNVDYSSASFDDGLFAWLMKNTETGQNEIYYYDANAASPGVVQLTDDVASKSQLTVSGDIIAWISSANNEIYTADSSEATVTIDQLTTTGLIKSSLIGKGGLLTWYEGTTVYFSNGSTVNQATADGNSDSIQELAIGSGNIAWKLWDGADNNIYYRTSTDAVKTSHVAATGITYWSNDLSIGDGIIAWSIGTSGYTHEGYLYTFGEAENSAITFTTMESGDDLNMKIDGQQIFWVQDLDDTGSSYPEDENPSSYLYLYDTAVAVPVATKVSTANYFRILTTAAAAGKAAWYGHDANRRLYVTRANDIGTPKAVTPAAVNARQPQISNGILVYKGMDRSEMDATNDDDEQEIYYCKLNVVGEPITRVTEDFNEDDKPFINGNLITWRNNNNDQVKFYNIATAATTTMVSLTDDAVRSDGRFVIWRDKTNQLYYYDTTAAVPVETAVTGATNLSKCPNISNGLLTWIRNDAGTYRIEYIDLNSATPTVKPVATAGNSTQTPQTDGRFIAWGGYYSGGSDYSINYFDTTAAVPVPVEISADYISDVCIPRLADGLIIFAALNYSDIDSSETDREIYAYDLNATTPTLIQLTDNDLWDSNPDVGNGVVIWRTGGASNGEWYGKITAALEM